MEPSVVNHLFKHRSEKVYMDVIKMKIQEQDNILSKQTKNIK